MNLRSKCILRDGIVSGVIGTLSATLPVWVYASVSDRVFIGIIFAGCVFMYLVSSDPTLERLDQIKAQREAREAMRPKPRRLAK